jgi:Phage Mu protein F like protein
MTTAPFVELRFNPTDLRPRDLPHAGAFLGSPAEAIEASLAVVRAAMVDQMRAEIRGLAEPTHAQLLRIADLAWQGMFWRYRKVSAPVLADAYIRAYRAAEAGDVPMSVIYDLADKHAEKIGDYFHESSREALADGFNTLVNRRVPAKAAADRVLDAYGLTPRQMRTYVGASQFSTPISDVLPRSVKARARAYIDKSFTGRVRKLSRQEEHNIDQQAQQFAWMWLQDKGRLNEQAMKLWITAKDERVCPVCGPLHGKKVKVNERFKTAQGDFWTPGLHPNCRCVVRLLEHRFSKADWDSKLHPRGGDPENPGRFSAKARRPAVREREAPVIATPSIWESLQEPEAEPEEKLSMTTAPAEGKLSMGGERLSMGGGLSMGGQLSMGSKLSMASDEKLSMDEKISMTEGKQKLSMAEAQEQLSMLTTPQMQMNMEQSFQRMVMAKKPYVRPKPRTLTRYDRPALRIQDDSGNEYPVYAVVRPGELNWNEGKVELNHTVSFTPSQSTAFGWANEYFNDEIVDRADAIHEDPYLTRLKHKDPSGREWVADLDDREVLEVVNWAAYQGRVSDPDTALDYDMSIEYVDQGGNRKNRVVPVRQVASQLGVRPKDFEVRIMRMDEGHDSPDGTTVMESAGTKYGYENWVTSGVYNAHSYRAEEVGHNLSLKMYWIDPDVKVTEKPFD